MNTRRVHVSPPVVIKKPAGALEFAEDVLPPQCRTKNLHGLGARQPPALVEIGILTLIRLGDRAGRTKYKFGQILGVKFDSEKVVPVENVGRALLRNGRATERDEGADSAGGMGRHDGVW